MELGLLFAAKDMATRGHVFGGDANNRFTHQIAHIIQVVRGFLQKESAGDIVIAIGGFPVGRPIGNIVGCGDMYRSAERVFLYILTGQFAQRRYAERETDDGLAAAVGEGFFEDGGLADGGGDGFF